MKDFIFISYICSLILGTGTLTMQVLTLPKTGGKVTKLQPFYAVLLIMNIYELFMYYMRKLFETNELELLNSIGDLLFAMLVICWIRLQSRISGTGNFKWTARPLRLCLCVYVIFWVSSLIYEMGHIWLVTIMDVAFMLILLLGTSISIVQGRKSGGGRAEVGYKFVVAFFMLANYIAYFLNHIGIMAPPDRKIELTIIYWMFIGIANVIFMYKVIFVDCYINDETPKNAEDQAVVPVQTLEDAISNIGERYGLTKRELEILHNIYDGKSNTQIAGELFISESTVKAHVYNTFKKLGVKNRAEAIHFVRREREFRT